MFGVGMRTFKTAFASAICFLIYDLFIPRTSYLGPFYSTIAIVITMQQTTERTFHMAKGRVLGTVIGGIVGAIYYTVFLKIGVYNLNCLFIFLGIISVIVICNKLTLKAGISSGCIVLIGTFSLVTDTTPVLHAFYRTIDTLLGVIISLIVNYSLPSNNTN